MDIRLKRAYEPPSASDGARILVDRLWPRGVRKEALKLTLWCKDIAPSPALRQWFDHRADRFDEFAARYRAELAANPTATAVLRDQLAHGRVTLVYAARDPQINQAVVLRDWLRTHAKG
ncbi:DUF488 domain-containing protein [Pseudoxanthomonas sangjuensis]|uniref:DUF488 domain-containing protein n=1 Tax=Pseudoxanthomonas sangjuensis TaxID=1503750 RepID=UPI001391BA06|nr:DUF488 domain-containing protein [Pseudoxanthomonas sangjuensis]KAF1714554.1 hypothetical protein CSC71_04095 [Pseudoxanthomonas sangjuensis]